MRDFGTSDDPAVQAQLDRLAALSVPQGRLGLETTRELLSRLSNPQDNLPPIFHVAGTNGKGSTCAFLRAMMEADGKRVHVTSSPHLVRYNERIRIAGALISDPELASILSEVLDAGADLAPSFFEVTIAASFLAFSRVEADACVVEVGLGGRFDATNVIKAPAVCGIASLGLDHERFLLAPEAGVPDDPLARIAFEKAGIAKPGAPLVTQEYQPHMRGTIAESAEGKRALFYPRGGQWQARIDADIQYRDQLGALTLPLPSMAGAHQGDNAALAVAMIRHQKQLLLSEDALAQGIRSANWPARLQLLPQGSFGQSREIWIDGGHNTDAGQALAQHFSGLEPNQKLVEGHDPARKLHLIIGMQENKDPSAIIGPLNPNIASITAVEITTHPSHPASSYDAFAPVPVWAANSPQDALSALPDDGQPVLIAGSLFLAAEVLRQAGLTPS